VGKTHVLPDRHTCLTRLTCQVRHDRKTVRRVRRHELRHALGADRPNQIVTQQLERIVRAQVPRHHLHPHDHVRPAPRLWFESQQRELRRQLGAVMRGDERVDPGDVRVDLFPSPRRRGGPRGTGRTAEADGAQESILRDRRRAENLRQSPVADPALKLHLPQPVLRVHVPQAEQRIDLGRREDVRNRIGIAHNLDRRGNAGHTRLAVDEGQRSPDVVQQAQGRDSRSAGGVRRPTAR
jgi:hypothetical protein